MVLTVVSIALLAVLVLVGLAALHFSILASMHVRPGVPAWKAWFRPLNGDPELYTDVGNRYRHFREVYSWIGLAIGLALGATRLLK